MGFKSRARSAKNDPYPGIIKPGLSEEFYRAVSLAGSAEKFWCYLMSLDEDRWNVLPSVHEIEHCKNLREWAIRTAKTTRELENDIKKAIAENTGLESYPAIFLDIAIHEQWCVVASRFVKAESQIKRMHAIRPKKKTATPRYMLWGVFDLKLRANGFSTDRIEKLVIESRDAFQEWEAPAPSLREYDQKQVSSRTGSALRGRLDVIRSRFSAELIAQIERTLSREAKPPWSMPRDLHARLSAILGNTTRKDKPGLALDIWAAISEQGSMEFNTFNMFGATQHAALDHAKRIFAFVTRKEKRAYPAQQILRMTDRERRRQYKKLRRELERYGFNLEPQEEHHIDAARLGGHAVIARILATRGFDLRYLDEDGTLYLPTFRALNWIPVRFLDPSIKNRLQTYPGRRG